jgi:putative transposase
LGIIVAAEKAGFCLPGIPVHVVQHGNCRQAASFSDYDYAACQRWPHEACLRHGCRIHTCVLVTNHLHLLMTPQTREAISRVIQYVGRYYVSYVVRCYGRCSTPREGRRKGCLISDGRYLLACMRDIELNPARSGMVAYPAGYA